MEHTPGPWSVDLVHNVRFNSIGGAYFIRANDECVARLTDEYGDRKANACLIAAAPELLDACHKALGMLPTAEDAPSEWMRKRIQFIQRVVKEAEGR